MRRKYGTSAQTQVSTKDAMKLRLPNASRQAREAGLMSEEVCDTDDENAGCRKKQKLLSVNSSKLALLQCQYFEQHGRGP